MKPLKNIEVIIRTKLHARADATLHDRVLERVREARAQCEDTTPAHYEPVLRSPIMKGPLTKVAIAAAVIAAVVLGLFEFIDTGSTSGTVWAEVAERVEASPGVIFRSRGTGSNDPNDDWPNAHKITWRSAAITRVDRYRDGQPYRTIYYNLDTKAMISLAHDYKKHMKEAMSEISGRMSRMLAKRHEQNKQEPER